MMLNRALARPFRGLSRDPLGVLVVLTACLALLPGCAADNPTRENPAASAPGPTFTGESYLYGTVQSFGRFTNNQPRLVSGYGMVVALNGTGSNEVPSFLRDWLVTEMGRNNIGSAEFGTESFTPQRVMADSGSAVVAVEGLIPPGAAEGTRFDLLVTMIDQTSTSLAGGRLFWPTTLSATGLDKRLLFTRSQATATGPMYVNPVRPGNDLNNEFLRQAVVIKGGIVTQAYPVEFILNNPSWSRSREIENRINERFPAGPEDRIKTAVAKSDVQIQINIPERFSGDPEMLLRLIAHMYLDPSRDFVPRQARRLAQALAQDPADRADRVSTAWKAMGRNTVPVLREYYSADLLAVRFAALEAGAWLQDNQSIEPLTALTLRGETEDRVRAARALVAFRQSVEARSAVRQMLNDPDMAIRLGAYEALAMGADQIIERTVVGQGANFKYVIDRVPSQYPMVFATEQGYPAVVIFGDDLGFRPSTFRQVGDTLTIRSASIDSMLGALAGLNEGDAAFLPINRSGKVAVVEPAANEPDGAQVDAYWEVKVGDIRGETVILRVRGEELISQVEKELLAVPNRTTVQPEPRKIALARMVQMPGRDDQGNMVEGIAELIALRPPDASLPLVVRVEQPGSGQSKTYRIQPTVATLAFTLGYSRSPHLAQIGPDLPYSTVVHALYQLCEAYQIPAPFAVNYNDLAESVARAQRDDEQQERPEFGNDEFEREQIEEGGAAPLDFDGSGPATPQRDDFGEADPPQAPAP
ncbi:MAG: flagellar basal body P-ring protein FlgI [Planctomycetota bacterium]